MAQDPAEVGCALDFGGYDLRHMMGQYILNDQGEPVPCPDLMTWGMWMETVNRHVGDEVIDGIRISTVFLGLDHRYNNGPPILWETMTFGADRKHWSSKSKEPIDQECDRCSGNREQAEAMHAEVVARVRAMLAERAAAVAGIGDLTDSEIETP